KSEMELTKTNNCRGFNMLYQFPARPFVRCRAVPVLKNSGRLGGLFILAGGIKLTFVPLRRGDGECPLLAQSGHRRDIARRELFSDLPSVCQFCIPSVWSGCVPAGGLGGGGA